MGVREGFFRGPGAVPARALLWLNAVGAGAYLWLQPRGFSAGSRPFLEHQVIVPAYFAVALVAAALPARWPAAGMIGTGALAAFWIAVSAVAGGVSSMRAQAGVWLVLLCAIGGGALVLRRSVREADGARAPVLGAGAGVAFAAAFLFCAWAPPSTTRPLGGPVPGVRPPGGPEGPGDRFRVSIRDRWVVIERDGDQVLVDPGFEFDAASRSGFWTVFDSRSLRLPAWKAQPRDGVALVLVARADPIETSVRVWVESDEVHLRAVTSLREEVSSHLSSVMTIYAPGPATVEDLEWPKGRTDEPAHFAAFRGGRLEFLRASRNEKGPFETLGSWEPRDPLLKAGPWSLRVRGWADHASRAESPTAGWGVSQGAIERWEGAFIWSLASTSIGRGWHAVRTAPGLYVLEAVIGRRPER